MSTHEPSPAVGAIVQVLRAGHVRVAVTTAVAVAVAAHLAHRTLGEVTWILITVLLGHLLIGWHNDLTDERDDLRHGRQDKPLVTGPLDPRTLWILFALGAVALIPLATAVGTRAGLCYIGSALVAMTGNVVLRTGAFSFVSWAVSYALMAYYVSFSGTDRHATGRPPEVGMVICFALIGVGIHMSLALWGLVADAADGWTYLPLQLGRKFGATQTMAMVIFYLAAVGIATTYVAHTRGFSR